MSIGNTHFEAAVESLSRRIAEVEARSTAAADRLAALTGTEADITMMEQQLWAEMDALWVLRQQLWELRAPEDA